MSKALLTISFSFRFKTKLFLFCESMYVSQQHGLVNQNNYSNYERKRKRNRRNMSSVYYATRRHLCFFLSPCLILSTFYRLCLDSEIKIHSIDSNQLEIFPFLHAHYTINMLLQFFRLYICKSQTNENCFVENFL